MAPPRGSNASRGGRPPGRRRPGAPKQSGPKSGARKGAARKPARKQGSRRDTAQPERAPSGWGGVARRGADKVRDRDDARGGPKPRGKAGSGRLAQGSGPSKASQAWRAAATDRSTKDDRAGRPAPRPPRDLEEWVLVEEIRDEAEHAVERSAMRGPRGRTSPRGADPDAELHTQMARAVGPDLTERAERRLRDASKDFAAERFPEAARRLRPLAQQAPSVAAVRELYGLTLYRLGRWKAAAKELEAFRTLTDSTEQHPVLADCYRALRQWRRVDELWDELREASPSAELVTEGRIVAAGALADRGKVDEAIRLLQHDWRFPKRPRVHHLRRAYALADLYERAGNLPRARELFGRVRTADPDFADVRARLRSLG